MQGFNMGRYVPPDVEGTTTGNRLHHHKRAAAAPTVRFEMPYAVWCATCAQPTLIGQGVRFNAEKRRVGAYHSTPVWSFRFRHAACGGAIEMRTDPRNTAYVVVAGGTRRDTGDAAPARPTDAQRRTAFASLERTIEDRERLRAARDRIADLAQDSARHWLDPYAQNQRLRRAFRAGRQQRAREAAATEALRDRFALRVDLDLLPPTDEDARRAALVDYGGGADDDGGGGGGGGGVALRKPLFGAPPRDTAGETLASEVVARTRAAQDPFLQTAAARDGKPPRLRGVQGRAARQETRGTGLVQYDSE